MADRTVSVKLVLDAAGYKRDAEEAAVATGHLDDKVQATDKDLKKLPKDATEAAAAMKALGVEAGGSRIKFEDFGKGARSSLEAVDQRIAATRSSVLQFADEFNRTGLVSAFERWKKATKDLSDLQKLKKELSGVVAEAQKLAGFGGSKQRTTIPGLIGKVPSLLNKGVDLLGSSAAEAGGGIMGLAKGLLNPAGASAVLAVASQLGVQIGGAITVGIGLAGIGAGVLLALHDPRVAPALANFKQDVGKGLKDAAQPFVEQTRSAVDIFDREFQAKLPGIKAAFAAIAPETTVLARGAAGFLGNMVDGIDSLLIASKPLIHQFGEWLPTFGADLGGIFQEIGAHSKEAQQGLYMLEDVLHGAAVAGKELIPVLSKIWDITQYFNAESIWYKILGADPATVHTQLNSVGDGVRGITGAVQQMNAPVGVQLDYWDRINADLQKAAQNFDRVFGITMTTQQANDQLATAFNNLSDSVAKNGKAFEGNSKQALANRDMVRQVEQGILAQRDATIAATGDTAAANSQYDAQQAALRKLLQSYHLTTAEIDALIGAYAKVPAEVNTTVNAPGLASATTGAGALGAGYKAIPPTVETTINTPGLGSASGAVAQYRDYLNSIPPFKATTLTLTERIDRADKNGGGLPIPRRWGGITEHAALGLVNAGIYSPMNPARYAFAEPSTQGEAFIPKNGDMGRSRDIWNYVGRNWLGMGSSASPTVNVAPPQVQVFIGDEDFTHKVRVVVHQEGSATAAAVSGGVRF